MRSSDFYVVRMSQANSIRHSVKSGSTIDMQALRALRKQVYVLPQVSVQGNSIDPKISKPTWPTDLDSCV